VFLKRIEEPNPRSCSPSRRQCGSAARAEYQIPWPLSLWLRLRLAHTTRLLKIRRLGLGSASFTFLTSRARGLHQHRGSGTADAARLPLEGLSAFGGGRKDCKIRTGRYPTTPLANRREILGPRLRRLSSGARDALRLLGAYVGPTRGGGWVACAKRQRSLALPKA
jgi:hypothetical protein